MTRPTMRFVPVKSEQSQATLLLHRTRVRPLTRTDRVRGLTLVRQQTQAVNAIRVFA